MDQNIIQKAVSAVKNKAQDIGKGLVQNIGIGLPGQNLVNLNQIKSGFEQARRQAQQSAPIVNLKNYLSQPLPQNLQPLNTKLEQFRQSAPSQLVSGFVQASNLGLTKPLSPPPVTTSQKVANVAGSFGAYLNPYTAPARISKTVTGLTNPLLSKVISPIASKTASKVAPRLVSGGANVLQGLVLDPSLNQKTTPLSMGIDFATGVIGGPKQFETVVGKGFNVKKSYGKAFEGDKLGRIEDAINNWIENRGGTKKIDTNTIETLSRAWKDIYGERVRQPNLEQTFSDVFSAYRGYNIEQSMKQQGIKLGIYGGESATGFEKAQNKFSNLTDKKIRFEIDDSKAKISINDKNILDKFGAKWRGDDINRGLIPKFKNGEIAYKTLKLSEVLDHPDLYKNYPELKDIKIRPAVSNYEIEGYVTGKADTSAYFDPVKKEIIFNPDMFVGGYRGSNYEGLKKTLLHEIQHTIQSIEGLARGGSPETITSSIMRKVEDGVTPFEAYRRLAGEVEARDVSARMNLTPEQRMSTSPLSSQGIPLSKQIVTDSSGRTLSKQLKQDPLSSLKQEARKYKSAEGQMNTLMERKLNIENQIKSLESKFELEQKTPGSFITGRSGLDSKLYKKQISGIDKTINISKKLNQLRQDLSNTEFSIKRLESKTTPVVKKEYLPSDISKIRISDSDSLRLEEMGITGNKTTQLNKYIEYVKSGGNKNPDLERINKQLTDIYNQAKGEVPTPKNAGEIKSLNTDPLMEDPVFKSLSKKQGNVDTVAKEIDRQYEIANHIEANYSKSDSVLAKELNTTDGVIKEMRKQVDGLKIQRVKSENFDNKIQKTWEAEQKSLAKTRMSDIESKVKDFLSRNPDGIPKNPSDKKLAQNINYLVNDYNREFNYEPYIKKISSVNDILANQAKGEVPKVKLKAKQIDLKTLPVEPQIQPEIQTKPVDIQTEAVGIQKPSTISQTGLEQPQTPTVKPSVSKPLDAIISNEPQRGFLETVGESGKTTQKVKLKVKELPQTYEVKGNQAEIKKADKILRNKGVDEAMRIIDSPLDEGINKNVLGVRLIKQFEKSGQVDKAIDLIEKLDIQAREQGRAIQALSLWNKLSPENIVRAGNRVAEKYGKQLPEETKKIVLTRMRAIEKMPEGVKKDKATLEVLNMIADKLPPTLSENFEAYRYTNLLSSPKTHERNIYQNTLNTLVTRPATLTFQALYDIAKHPNNPMARDVSLSDVPLYYKNVFTNLNNAFGAAKESMKTNPLTTDIQGATAIEALRRQKTPKALQVIPKFMQAQDQFFSSLIATAEKTRLLKKGIGEVEANNTAKQVAEDYLLRTKLGKSDKGIINRALDSIGKIALDGRKLPVLGKPWSWFVPFVTTPINAAKMMVDYTPVGIVGAKMTSENLAKATAGSLAMYFGANLASQDRVTWEAPTDAKEKEMFYASGKKPFSVLIGDKWVPAWYFGPFALSLLTPAAIKQYNEQSPTALTDTQLQKIGKAASSLSKFVVSQTPLQGIGSFFSLLEGDADFTIDSIVGSLGVQAIPLSSLQRYINTIIDDVYRKGTDVSSQIKKAVVGQTFDLPQYTTPTGEPSKRLGVNALLPYDIGQRQAEYEPLEKARIQTLQENKLINKAKKDMEATGGVSQVNNKYIIKTDTGFSTIDISTPINKPELTGQVEVDKKLNSQYNSKIESRITDLVKLVESKQLDPLKVEQMITDLRSQKVSSQKTKKVKRVKSIKAPKAKKIKLTKIKFKSIKMPKIAKIKIKKQKPIKLAKLNTKIKLT